MKAKIKYSRPFMVSEVFTPQEYVALCWGLEPTAITGWSGQMYKDINNNNIFDDTDYQEGAILNSLSYTNTPHNYVGVVNSAANPGTPSHDGLEDVSLGYISTDVNGHIVHHNLGSGYYDSSSKLFVSQNKSGFYIRANGKDGLGLNRASS